MTEKWERIKGYEEAYEVSNLGRVRSLTRKTSDGRTYQGRLLKLKKNYNGYMRVGLTLSGSTQKFHSIHRLVATAFLSNNENKPDVNHKDGNKRNNVHTNLEWVTKSENMQHAYDKGLAKGRAGEKNSQAVLTTLQAKKIKVLLAENTLKQSQIAKIFGVKEHVVGAIKRGRSWITI